jgi:hypothetical protein
MQNVQICAPSAAEIRRPPAVQIGGDTHSAESGADHKA